MSIPLRSTTAAVRPARAKADAPVEVDKYARSVAHQKKAHDLIPGGAHTYAKGDDQLPESSPIVVERGEGCHVWDVDGNQYVEYGMGLRAVTLGHAEPRVTAAAIGAMQSGTNFTRPAAIEFEAAEAFLDLIEGAEMVKFCKDGSNATTAAVKLARAATGRDKIAICSSHPFLSQNDWFIGCTTMNAGVPKAIQDLTVRFPYGHITALETVFALHPGQIAGVVMEPSRGRGCSTSYLLEVQRVCRENGAVLIFDEMITGFRWHKRGAQHLFGVTPDLSTFGKALANGFSVSALAGKRELMELGGLTTDQERVFLLSGTHGAETHGLAAAIETMRIYDEEDVVGTLYEQGKRLRRGVEELVSAFGLQDQFGVLGRDCNLVYFTRDAEGEPSQAFRTLFLQEMLKNEVLAPSFVVSAAHSNEAIDKTIDAVGKSLAVYKQAVESSVADFLIGRPVKPVFRRFV